MDNTQFVKFNNIPQDKFEFVSGQDYAHDKKLETKSVGYLRDAMRRFAKNKGSVVAAFIILLLVLFAIIGPFCFNQGYQDAYATHTVIKRYKELLPKVEGLEGTGFWDGTKTAEVSDRQLAMYRAMGVEMGRDPVVEMLGERTTYDVMGKASKLYKIRLDTYAAITMFTETLTPDQYQALQDYQNRTGKQVILPRVNKDDAYLYGMGRIAVWYKSDSKGNPEYDKNGNFIPAYYTQEDSNLKDLALITGYNDGYNSLRLAGDPGIDDPNSIYRYHYAQRTGSDGQYNYLVRVNPYNYFEYLFGFEPCFTFGSDSKGFDILSRLASGARFSLILALLVSVVNLTIGAIYGAIEGYYGGVVDMAMERFSDILANVPFMIVTVLFKLHLAAKVGLVGALIFAFILTGWIGMASRVRMQFYRFKNQEYVLAARTLGARDRRIIWKHIFPNSLGTIITGTVLVIPGVIFSETSLAYLNIINLDSPTMSSVGAMLSAGQAVMTSSPHVVLFPALFIALLMISFNLFGNGLRDAFNPSLRGSEG